MKKIGLWYIFFCLSFMNHNVFADEALGIDKQSEASQSISVNNEDLANNNRAPLKTQKNSLPSKAMMQ